MIDLNQLRQLMDFYRNSGVSQDYSSHDGFNATPYNPNADALRWATQAMGPQAPQRADVSQFFGGAQGGGQGGYQPAQYTAPQAFQGKFQMPQAQQQPMTGQVNNYLATMMGRR